MSENIILLILSAFTVVILCVTFVYVVGIVWRVEMELDLSYKFLAAALFFLVLSEVFGVFPGTEEVAWRTLLLYVLKLLVAINFFIGMFYMRDLIRKLDGELEEGATGKGPKS